MKDSYKMVFAGGSGEIVVKKSRFIASVFSVENTAEAENIIEQVKKKYWDARHNCYAYVIKGDTVLKKCSDDGEPQGTAGRPMLDVLCGEEIYNILVVVTRYFGGTLLGTGGLIRAYTDAVKEGIKASDIMQKYRAYKVRVTADYTFMGKIQYTAASHDIAVHDIIYGDKVEFVMLVQHSMIDKFIEMITSATSASAGIQNEGEVWYGCTADGNVHVFDK